MTGRAGGTVVVALAAVCLLLGLAASGQAAAAGERAESSVIKGKTAPIADYPWLAYVRYEGPLEEFSCSGTVIAPRLVLTAGHCAVSESGRVLRANAYEVTWGTANHVAADRLHVAKVGRVLVFPDYDPTSLLHDAALLILAEPVGAPPIPLATAADSALYAGGTPITIAGWGLMDGFAPEAPTAFRVGELTIAASSYCKQKTYRYIAPFNTASQLCTSDRRQHEVNACNGDSGGPGIARRADGSPVQVGVISSGGPFCDLDYPGIQTRVDAINPWVTSWIAAVEAGAPPPAVPPPHLYRLPKLSFLSARLFIWLGLNSVFHNRFSKGRTKHFECRRIDREKVKCAVFWRRLETVYGGAATIFLVLPREGSLVRMRYRIRRVRTDCWQRRGSFERCPGHTFRR